MEMEALLREMEAYAAEHHVPILREGERSLFVRLVREANPLRALELGTGIGYSTLLLAMSGAMEILSLERDGDRAATARNFIRRSAFGERIRVLAGDASKLLEGLEGPFDFLFLDAAKGQYPRYFRQALPLLSPRAMVLADNVLFRGYVRSADRPPRRFRTIAKRLKEYLGLVGCAPGFATEILEEGDGLAVSRRFGYEEETGTAGPGRQPGKA